MKNEKNRMKKSVVADGSFAFSHLSPLSQKQPFLLMGEIMAHEPKIFGSLEQWLTGLRFRVLVSCHLIPNLKIWIFAICEYPGGRVKKHRVPVLALVLVLLYIISNFICCQSGSTMASTNIDAHQDELLTSLLASSTFSVSSYLNTALQLPPTAGASETTTDEQHRHLEQQMANLALQLQIRTQSCHDEIGRIGAELQAVLPRCSSDVHRVSVGLDGMEMDLRGLIVHEDEYTQSSPQQRQDDALTTLHTLLNLKSHLQSSRVILSAAASWDETIRSIPALLAEANDFSSDSHQQQHDPSASRHLIEAVQALSTLEAGERALRVMPSGREERTEALTKLRSRTEAMLKPQLLHALNKTETRTALLRQCVEMYRSLGKLDVLELEYVKARPGEVLGLWFSFGGTSTGVDVVEGGNAKLKEEEEEVEDFDFTEDIDGPPPTSKSETLQHSLVSTAQPKQQFNDFLPDFYEAVLELLAKERNQARLIFGAEMAPSIVVRVLTECFKPLVTSFGRRLENLCPLPNSPGNPSSSEGGMESIAQAYESTVQFLSLAYDQMEAWEACSSDISAKASEENGAKENDNQTLIDTIKRAFVLIASPFVPYQQSLVEAERHPLGEAASMIARDVRSVNNLQDSSERLGDLAPFMFPLAQGKILIF